MRPLRLAPLLLALLPACGDAAPISAGHTPPPPATTGTATDPGLTSSDSATGASPCSCGPGQYCAAEYDPGDPEPPPEAFECRAECIPPAAPGFWCFDDASCCTGSCRADGLCGSPPAETDAESTAGGSTTGGSTTGGSTTGGSTTDAGTSGTSGTSSSG